MSLEGVALGYAFSVGAASFFSPCSVGLLPAYMGYFLAAKTDPETPHNLGRGIRDGLRLGLAGSLGFFVLFAGLALLFRLIPLNIVGPNLPYISIGIGVIIALLGIFLLAGGNLAIRLPKFGAERTKKSIFLFGFAYALASLGCTFPLFLSVVLGGFASGDPVQGALGLVAYALGMAVVMTAITTALAVSQERAARFVRKAVPVISKVAAAVMVAAGIYIVYFWVKTLNAIS